LLLIYIIFIKAKIQTFFRVNLKAVNMRDGELVVPGSRIASLNEVNGQLGDGVYSLNGSIYSCTVGRVRVTDEVVEVERMKPSTPMPKVGDQVTARVLQVQVNFALVEILAVGSTVLQNVSFQGRIRTEDVRAFEKDTVDMYKSFRPGDIVRAKVTSLGVSRLYYLTTAENELGVIVAKSSTGNAMIPISWQEMQDPITKQIQPRKVAKVDL
jgi:exosome complex component CSL4